MDATVHAAASCWLKGRRIISSHLPRRGADASTGEGRGVLPPDFIEEVRHAADIVRVVEEHVALKRAGRTLKGLCPFHSEKTPSFTVDEAKGFYYCFGCGAGGDVFKFVMQQEAISFPEAVRWLADRVGLRVPESRAPGPGDEVRERVLAVNRAAQELFAELLQDGRRADSRAAREYLERRGIGADTIDAFGLGWAPDSWDFTLGRLSQRFEMRDVTAAGLAVPRDSGRGAYDRFRGRITFPIRAISDRILGFGGRIVGDGEPKYLNSPETPVYTKGRHLYGLDRARAAIRKAGRAVLVEGYLDAISLHAAGIENAVAVLGTALTPEQARVLSRFAKEVHVNFDGDAAGLRAARRSIEVLLPEGLDVRVVQLPDGDDPDRHVRTHGAEAYERALDEAPDHFAFLLRLASKKHDLERPGGRVTALNELLPFIVRVRDRVLRSELVDAACHGLGIRSKVVREEVNRALRRGREEIEIREPDGGVEASIAERTLLSWMLTDDRARSAFRGHVDDEAMSRLARADIYQAILAEPDSRLDIPRILERLPDAWQRQLVSECAVDPHHEPVDEEAIPEKIRSFVAELGISGPHVTRRRKAEVDRLLQDALRRGDGERARQLMAEAQALGKAMHT